MNVNGENNCLIIGIGNSGRQDDGLGWAFLDFMNNEEFEKLSFEYKYQLQIEDAELIGNFDTVIFVDASKCDLKNGFTFETCKASNKHSFSTHALVPETILFLSEELYGNRPNAFILAIQGYEWELQNGLTNEAKRNLESAISSFKDNFSISS